MSNINKITFQGKTLVDLTKDTVTSKVLREGITTFNRYGEHIIGAAPTIIENQMHYPSKYNVQILPNSFLLEDQTIKGEPNLSSENIRKNISIYGITGNCQGLSSLTDYFTYKSGTFHNNNIYTIGPSVFTNAQELNVSFPNCSIIQSRAFFDANIVSYNFNNCTSIGMSAFAYCDISETNFPKCDYIDSWAFANCSNIIAASFPLCRTLGSSTFSRCNNLTTVAFPECVYTGYHVFAHCHNLINISLPKLSAAGPEAFWDCCSLTNVSLPLCGRLNTGAFSSCVNLINVDIPNCNYIGNSVFQDCFNLSYANFSLCSSIGWNAFWNCSNLSYANFPECTTLTSGAFTNCINLTTINFSKCSIIGDGAFDSCYNLINVSMPEFTSVGGGIWGTLFFECHNLSTISFPKAKYFPAQVFCRCYNLLSLYLMGSSICTLASSYYAFSSSPIGGYTASTNGKFGSIYVPASLYSSYISATNWVYFSKRFAIPESVQELEAGQKNLNSSETIQLALDNFKTVPTCTVISSDSNIISVSDISASNSLLSFTLNYLQIGITNITITVNGEQGTYVFTYEFEIIEAPAASYEIIPVNGASYGFAENSSGYWESQNKGINNSYAICQVNINAPIGTIVHFDCINYTSGESNYDFGLIGQPNQTLSLSYTADSNVLKNFKGLGASTSVQTVSLTGASESYFVQIKFRKDSVYGQGNDSLQFKVRIEEIEGGGGGSSGPASASWTVEILSMEKE